MDWTKEIKQALDKMPTRSKNIRMVAALKNLIENIDSIPVEKIEALANE